MKPTAPLLLFILLLNLHFSAEGQNCTGCTTTISTATSFPQVVSAGSKLCITSTGAVNAPIVIMGGEVCNNGTINSTEISISSNGVLKNYNSLSATKLGMLNGTVLNAGTAVVDSLGLNGSSLTFTNQGTLNTISFGLHYAGTGTLPVFNNNGTMTADSVGITSAGFNNGGHLQVNFDFGHHGTGSFNNNGTMAVGRDFGNTGEFFTSCIIPVGRDWANAGMITGPVGMCGGFRVSGQSGNSGNYGADQSNLDFCDLGPPQGGFDGNTGNVGSNVTYCACNNLCQIPTSIAPTQVLSQSRIIPNPFSDYASVQTNYAGTENLSFTIINVLGQVEAFYPHITADHFRIRRNELPAGIYFYQLSGEKGVVSTGKMVVE